MAQTNSNLPDTQKMTFQQAMSRLEQITTMLSNPNLELEQAMQLFQEGLALSNDCQSQLDAFENQMNTLMAQNDAAKTGMANNGSYPGNPYDGGYSQ